VGSYTTRDQEENRNGKGSFRENCATKKHLNELKEKMAKTLWLRNLDIKKRTSNVYKLLRWIENGHEEKQEVKC